MKKFFVNNRNILLTIIGIMLIINLMIYFSYAMWQITKTQSGENVLVVGSQSCFRVVFTKGTDINLENAFPKNDIDGMKTKPLEFTLYNDCEDIVEYEVHLEVLSGSTLDSQYIKVALDDETPKVVTDYPEVDKILDDANNAYNLKNDVLESGSNKTYNLRKWIDESTPNEAGSNSVYFTKVVVVASEGLILKDTIIANNTLKVTTPNFGVASSNSDTGMYAMDDDYGTSYYFRGTKTLLNNTVAFGGFRWKVLRINGDGSIRLVFDGKCSSDACTAITGSRVPVNSAFAPAYTASKYQLYVYDTSTSSTLKTTLENWYRANLSSYDSQIQDAYFCNDSRQTQTTNDGWTVTYYYYSYDRIAPRGSYSVVSPTLKCALKTDRYTKDDDVIGNKKLGEKVGTITGDEAAMAGWRLNTGNTTYYLYAGVNYWTMSPLYYYTSSGVNYANEVYINDTNAALNAGVSNSKGARPVINLKPDVRATGLGSEADPYIVK